MILAPNHLLLLSGNDKNIAEKSSVYEGLGANNNVIFIEYIY